MDFKEYLDFSKFYTKNEDVKIALLAFYHLKVHKKNEFNSFDISEWFDNLNLVIKNPLHLYDTLKDNNKFIKGNKYKSLRLNGLEIHNLESIYPKIGLEQINEEVLCNGAILPETLYVNTRGFIEKLSKQINASYENNIFDGCAVLMRRLLEILLILSYEHLDIQEEIKDDNGNYYLMEKISRNAKSNSILNLSRNARADIELFRELGNYSAHKIHYNCKKSDISNVLMSYRATIEELLYKAGILK